MKGVSTSKVHSNSFKAGNNPGLSCIEVDDTASAKTKWTNKDNSAQFRLDCDYASINEIASGNQISIYPNPTKGEVHLDLGSLTNTTINVFNPMGQLVLTDEVSERNYQLKLPDATGIYFIKIRSNGEAFSYKVVKE